MRHPTVRATRRAGAVASGAWTQAVPTRYLAALEREPGRPSPGPGSGFTESLYERERFEEVLHVAADIRAGRRGGPDGVEDAEGLVEEWLGQVGRASPAT